MVNNSELVRVVAFDANGDAFPVGFKVKTTRRQTAPYSKWALINLESPLLESVRTLNQTQARILLALIFTGNPLRLKDLAVIVGAPTSQVCREAKPLVQLGAVERIDGAYRISATIRWIGKWRKDT